MAYRPEGRAYAPKGILEWWNNGMLGLNKLVAIRRNFYPFIQIPSPRDPELKLRMFLAERAEEVLQARLLNFATWGGAHIGDEEMYSRLIFCGKDHSLGLHTHQFGRL